MNSSNLRGIYGITDDALLMGSSFFNKVETALSGSLCLLQYRCKNKNYNQRKQIATELLILCRAYNTPLIINDDPNLCAEIGADGVHLGRSDMPLEEARRLLGPAAIIGITCHDDLESAKRAQAGSASYVAFGRFFGSNTKPSAPPASIDTLRRAHAELQIPTVAIGGINAENGKLLVEAGASMLAVVGSLFGGENIENNSKLLNQLY